MATQLAQTVEPRQSDATKFEAGRAGEIERLETQLVIGEPVWAIAQLFPGQGQWSEEEYLALDTNHFVEFSHGCLEVLEMPTESHQDFALLLYELLRQFVKPRNSGKILLAPFRIQLWPGKYREPDVIFMLAENSRRRSEHYWIGADLVMEIISPNDRNRDVVTKRHEYAQAGIPEYWLIDPQSKTITVFALQGTLYTVHGEFGLGAQATSRLLAGFTVDVALIFAAQ